MRLEGRAALVLGADSPWGAALARALEAAGATIPGEEAERLDLLVEATPLPAFPPLAAPAEDVLALAARPLLRLPALAARLAPGGALLVVTAATQPAEGWLGAHLAFRAGLVEALARELAPRGARANGLVAPIPAARLPGFLARGLAPGVLDGGVDFALALLAAPGLSGATIPLGRGA
jgi:hypothetical protein